MKRLAVIVSACSLLAGILIGTAVGRVHRTGQYPASGIVTSIDRDADVVEWTDGAGRVWSFYGVEDWMVGDGISAIMDDNGTAETVYDDVILSVRYTG